MITIPEIFIELLELEYTKQKFGQLDPKKRVERKDELFSLNKQIALKLEESKHIYLNLDFKTRSEVIDYFDIKEYKLIYSKLDKKLPVEPTIKKSTIEDEKKVQSPRQKRDAHRIVQSINNWMKTYNSEEKDKELSFLTKNIFRSNYVNPSIYADKDNSILVFSILLCMKELERRTSDINQNLIYRNSIKKICYYFPFTELPGESEYHGQIRDDLFDGFGVKIDKKYTDVYIGEFQKDRRAGFGLQVYDNGDFYYGEFQNDLRHGYGHYFWSDGEECECNWLNGDQIDETLDQPDIIDLEPISSTSPKEEKFNKTLPPFELILKEFKNAHDIDFRILETNNEDLNNLIRLVVMDNHISETEKQFLVDKTKELDLSNELIQHAEDYLETDNPFLDKIFKLIFNDGIVSQNELDFIHEKNHELDLDEAIVNQRFWDYAIHFHLNDLLNIEGFKKWIIIWYIYEKYIQPQEKGFLANTASAFNIFKSNNLSEIINKEKEIIEKECFEKLKLDVSFNETYSNVLNSKVNSIVLTTISELHKDALCWIARHKNKELKLSEFEGEKIFRNGKSFLLTRAKGIYKPERSDFGLSIKVLMNSKYDDKIKEKKNGTWQIKYHKEDDNEWTNEGLKKCMENSVPVGLFYQVQERSPSIYKIYGLGLVEFFDGEYFYINSIKEQDELKFDWNPLSEIKDEGNLSKIEKEIIELYKDEPFLSMQKFKKFYKSKIKKATQSEINNAFEQLINQS